ncbi:MAG: hypothetical protein AB7O32_14550 [Vicinamibacterales bacterium]
MPSPLHIPLPEVSCPRCRRAAEYQATIEVLQPPIGKVDIAYCAGCQCLFEVVRETGTAYDSTTWLPICRTCRQPVAPIALSGAGDELTAAYACREHADERWQYRRQGERWARA